jgi:hypothetical protein
MRPIPIQPSFRVLAMRYLLVLGKIEPLP